MKKLIALTVGAILVSSAAGAADFGQKVEQLAKAQALSLFGILGTLGASSSTDLSAAAANANPAALLTVAPGLSVRVLSAAANLGPNTDQMVLWPNGSSPTHILTCNEQGTGQVAVQRVDINTGLVENIISSGVNTCDPIRITPWGTVIAGEEAGTAGRLFEILDPIGTTNVTVFPGTAPTSDPAHVVVRSALGQFSFEGIGILPSGIVYLTDELRPGNDAGAIGNAAGSIVKFIPTTLWTGGPPITDLAQSPWTAGRIFGLRIGRNSGNTDVGQGNEYGRGYWVEITGTAPINLRAAAQTLKLTGYYRPEDMSVDLKQLNLGTLRVCGTNTGQDTTPTSSNGDNHYGEIYCLTDGTVAAGETITTATGPGGVTVNTSTIPEYHTLILGTPDMGMPDNIDIQPGRGNFLINEDGDGPGYSPPRNNDIWDCLDDGADVDLLTDACVKVATLNDLTAEPTGGFFDSSGTRYFVSIQHNKTLHGVILEINGWQP
jgi:hypothetical protein